MLQYLSFILLSNQALGYNGYIPEVETTPYPGPSSCMTMSGKPCELPFVYNNKLYFECTYDDSKDGKAWCFTETGEKESCDPSVCDIPETCIAESGPAKGNPCKFPFKWGGVTYHSCAKWKWHDKNYGKYWCSTKVDENENHVNKPENLGFCGFCENAACGCGCNASADDRTNNNMVDYATIDNFDPRSVE